MKKNLTFLTGIVFLIAILVAGGCDTAKKQKEEEKAGTDPEVGAAPKAVTFDPKKVDIYLKDTLINGSMHLFMSDSKKPECGVIDNHTAYVHPRYTVKWRNADDSNIDKIKHIRVVGIDTTFFGAVPEIDPAEVDTIEFFRQGVYKLVMPDIITYDTILKYEIIFTIKKDTTTHIIDPYLKIPPQSDPPE